jgi:hypothetical protein
LLSNLACCDYIHHNEKKCSTHKNKNKPNDGWEKGKLRRG